MPQQYHPLQIRNKSRNIYLYPLARLYTETKFYHDLLALTAKPDYLL